MGGFVANVRIAGHLLLLEAPLGQLLVGGGEHAALNVVVEGKPARNGFDHLARLAADDLHHPHVVRVSLALLMGGKNDVLVTYIFFANMLKICSN